MSNFFKRLILVIIFIPFIIVILFWPEKNHIILVVFYGILVTFLGSIEYTKLISIKGKKINLFFIPVNNLLIYIFAYFYANNLFDIKNFKPIWILFFAYLILIISLTYSFDIFKKNLKGSFEKMSNTLFGLIYIGLPSFVLPFIINIDVNLTNNSTSILFNISTQGSLSSSLLSFFFITLVLTNDIFAYVFGKLFGKSNILGLTASPNKSWAGYIGGFFSTLIFVTIFYFTLFNRFLDIPWWFYYSFLLISNILVPIGDLVESIIKRSIDVKDSGSLIIGRGGILDSADTILYLLPVYFIFLQIYFAFK